MSLLRKRIALAAGGGILAAGAAAIAWLSWPSAAPAAPAPPPAKAAAALPGAGGELVALIDSGKNRTYFARYRATSPDNSTGLTMEVYQQPPRKREDVTMTAGGKSAKTSTFLLPGKSLSCEASAGGPWTCTPGSGAASGGIDTLSAQIAKLGATSIVRGADESVAGHPARCYRIKAPQNVDADVCVTPDGVPAKVAIGPSKFELTELTDHLPDSAFTPPV